MSTYTIRPMTIADYDECYALWQITSGADGRVDCGREVIRRILARNPDTCFAAMAGDRLIGTITSEFGGDGAYISHLAVSPDMRRLGIAAALVEAVEEKLTALGVRKSRILVFAENETAKQFWQSRGYGQRERLTFMDKKLY